MQTTIHIKPAPFVPRLVPLDGEPAEQVKDILPALPTQRKRSGWHSLPLAELQDRRTLKTFLFDGAGLLIDAQINLSDGSITPHKYKVHFTKRPVIRAKAEPSDIAPPWMRIAAPDKVPVNSVAGTSTMQKKPRGRPSKTFANRLKIHLQDFNTAAEVFAAQPRLEDIIVGVAGLDLSGNTRPLNKQMIAAMLCQIDPITSGAVEKWMNCGKRHAQKVALCLQIIVTGAMRITDSRLAVEIVNRDWDLDWKVDTPEELTMESEAE